MKKWNILYENCQLPIRIACVGFVLMAFGFLIQNDSVNIFYTFSNTYLLIIAELSLKAGETIIKLLPLFFLSNLCAKKANSGVPIAIGLIGYLVFHCVTMIFSTGTFPAQCFTTMLGISYDATSLPTLSTGIRYPLDTGLIGAFIVGLATRYSYIRSRNRSSYSLFGLINKDTVAAIYNIMICGILGFAVTCIYPALYAFLSAAITRIAANLNDPGNMAMYGILDRVLSMLCLPNLIRTPFWFGSQGGTYQSIAGQNIVGDVNIWSYITEAAGTYAGCGRFITPYYAINIFILPAIYLGLLFSITDRTERNRKILFLLAAIAVTAAAGNPLPLEYLLLFTSPLLLLIYLLVVAAVFAVMTMRGVYLGFSFSGADTRVALPGSFPDYIINIRNPQLYDTVVSIFVIGMIAAVVMFVATILYYRYMSYDLAKSGKTDSFVESLFSAIGGKENVVNATSSLFRLNLRLKDLEAVNFDKISEIGARRLTETREGISLDLGSSSTYLSLAVNRKLKELIRE